jgi:rRNA maturation endonuclease Nob1
MTDWNKCPGCGSTASGNAAFCPNCGEPWTIRCPNCGLTGRFWKFRKFCAACGARIEWSRVIEDKRD